MFPAFKEECWTYQRQIDAQAEAKCSLLKRTKG
jgi:hypothetical protein